MNEQITIELKGKQFPLYETKRGAFDFEQAGFSMRGISNGKSSDLQAFVFYSAKACAKREGIKNFPYPNLDAFVDDEDVDIETIGKAFVSIIKKDDSSEDEPGEAEPEKPATN